LRVNSGATMKTTPAPEVKKPSLLAPPQPTKNWLAKDNAAELSEKIRHFWLKKGRMADVRLVPLRGFHASMGWCIRSDMINGHPVG